MTTIYDSNDTYLVRKGEIAVEFAEVVKGDVAPYSFAKFRSYKRAQAFASKKRAEGCRVKAWKCTGDDTSQTVQL